MRNSRWLGATLVLALLGLPASADAIMWEMVPRTWRLAKKHSVVTFQVHKERRYTLSLSWKRGQRRKLTIAGSYKVTVVKHNHKSVTFKVTAIGSEVLIGGKPARRDLVSVDAFQSTFSVGKKKRFTVVTGCSGKRDWLQLCLHETRKGKPHVPCKTLHAPRKTKCSPPVDGRMINPPPDWIRNRK